MDRRNFILRLSSLMACQCSCGLSANARPRAQGCRSLASSSGVSALDEMRGLLQTSSGLGPAFDQECEAVVREFKEMFGVNPGFSFYQDGPGDQRNALADSFSYAGGVDGTVMIGLHLLSSLRHDPIPCERPRRCVRQPSVLGSGLVVIAHEFGHILQFTKDVPDCWEMEMHADFMAGWALAKYSEHHWEFRPTLLWTVEAMFGFGDTAFTAATHHGEPHLRRAMVKAGYESRVLSVSEAFDKGAQWARLPPHFGLR